MEHDAGYLSPGPDIEAIIDAPPTPIVRISPDQQWLLLVHYTATPPLEMLAQPFERLAGLRIDRNTGTTRRTYNFTRITLRHILEGATHDIELADGALRFSSVSWSPTSAHMAYTALHDDGLRLWVLDLATMTSTRLLEDARVNDTLSGGMRWMPGGEELLVTTVPGARGPVPEPPRVPASPKIQITRGREAQNRTYQDLLEDAHDDDLFAYYTTSQLVRVGVDGAGEVALGEPAMLDYAAPSPDKRYLLVKTLDTPFSRVVPEYYFAHTITVRSADDFSLVTTIAEQPLAEEIPIQGVRTGVRGIGWKPLHDATLMWVEALDGGDPSAEVDHRDKLVVLHAPFEAEATELLRIEERYRGRSSIQGDGSGLGKMLITEYDRDRRWVTTTLHDFDEDAAEPRVFIDRSIRDQYNNPGSPVLVLRPDGTAVLDVHDGHVYMAGAGATPEGDRPFLDRRSLADDSTERVFHCGEDHYSYFIDFGPEVDGERSLIVHRESPSEPGNIFWVKPDGEEVQLTSFTDPHPHLTGIQKRLVKYEREDGVPLSGTLYLPPDYQEGQRLPLVVWAYPVEYNDASTAGQVRAQPTKFTRLAMTSPLMFVTRGYAVLDRATMPVVGDPETMNDTFVEQIVGAAKAAIDAMDDEGVADTSRVGVGGHSYGAFMVANLLAHSRGLFRAGIARSGAYNRSLTPFGFQSERRTLWKTPETYVRLSPFFHADEIEDPLLLIHGEVDSNSGTYPMQSERLFHAISGLGGTARLVVLPHESHGYRSRESVLHVLTEQFSWFDAHVMNATDE